MREKYIFLIGLGTGLVITSIISLFSYNILKTNNNYIDESTITTTTIIPNTITEQLSNVETYTEITTTPLTTKATTTTKLELSSKPNLEITTNKPFEISTN